MSANRSNINWHLANMIGGQMDVPLYGTKGYHPGAACFKTTGSIGLGLYINRGTLTCCDFRGTEGQSPLIAGGAEQLLYEVDLTQNYEIGAVEKKPDGREFRYCKSTAAGVMRPDMGCNFTDTGYTAYTVFVVSAAIGATEVTVPAATHAALTKNALRGGYITIFDTLGVVTYQIVGNDAADANTLFKVTLDMPLAATVTSADYCETYKNPWGIIAQSTDTTLPKAGVPVASVSAAANYFWLQTKGIKFINPQPACGADNGGIEVFWRHDGSLQKGETALGATVPAYDLNQSAGIVIAGSTTGNGPLIALKGY